MRDKKKMMDSGCGSFFETRERQETRLGKNETRRVSVAETRRQRMDHDVHSADDCHCHYHGKAALIIIVKSVVHTSGSPHMIDVCTCVLCVSLCKIFSKAYDSSREANRSEWFVRLG